MEREVAGEVERASVGTESEACATDVGVAAATASAGDLSTVGSRSTVEVHEAGSVAGNAVETKPRRVDITLSNR